MNENKCDDWVIDVCSNIIFLPERSMAIEEYMRITKNDSIPFDINNIWNDKDMIKGVALWKI